MLSRTMEVLLLGIRLLLRFCLQMFDFFGCYWLFVKNNSFCT